MTLSSRSLLQPLLAAALLAVGLLAAAWLKVEADSRNALVTHTQDVRLKVVQVFAALQDAETNQRGYIITGDASYLETYDTARDRAGVRFGELGALTTDNPVQVAATGQLQPLIEQKLGLLAKGVALRKSGDEAGALTLIKAGPGHEVMEDIRTLLAGMDAEERRLFDARMSEAQSTDTLLLVTLAGSGLLAIVIIWLWLSGIRAAARELAERTRERDSFWNLSRDMLAILDREGKVVSANPAWRAATGWSEGELRDLSWIGELFHEDDQASAVGALSQIASGGLDIPVEVRMRAKDGSYRWISGIGAADGALVYASARDVTLERQQAEALAASEAKVLQIQKMEAIGQLTGGVAHDFNNMLAIIIGSLNLVDRRLARGDGASPDVLKFLAGAMEGATRAATLTQRLLAFARRQPLAPETVNVNDLVAKVSELLRRTLGEEIALETVLAGGLWQTNVDVGQMEQALVNLAVNARDAMPVGGKLTIETMNAHLDDAYARENDTAAGQYVMIGVTDTGTGMTPDVLAQAFEPFFSTKPTGKGTGLGLSMVFGFIKQSGGHIKIYSEPGVGTTVKFYLPRLAGAAKTGAAAQDMGGELPPGNPTEVILVVEDEDRVRRFSVDALRDLGYTAIHASSGEEALGILAERPDIKLLFTDVVMPVMNGAKLVEAARQQRRDLRVLFTTGYTRNAIVHNGTLDQGVDLLSKPFTLPQLAFRVRAVLDAPPK